MEKRVRQLLDDIQHKFCTEAKALDLWKKIYNSANYEEFTKLFCQILQGIIQENYNNPYVKTIIAAMGKFVAEVSSRETKGLASPENLLLRDVISNIIRDHTEENEHFKFNVCSFLSVTLQNMDKNVEVDESVIRIVQDSLLEKLEDPKPLIRQQAVSALASIQCPFKRDCPVVGSLITCLINPHPSVRREVVKNIALTGISFSHIYKRTRDTDASVRRAAFSRMADIDPTRHLRITQRQYILKSGILETNQCTKKLFSELLLAKWLTAYNGNYIEFLKGIKLDADENDIRDTEKLSGQIMEFFLKSQPLNKIIEILPLDEDKLIPESSLQTEVVLYWNIVLKYLRQSEDLEEYIEQLIPELIIFCGYIQRIIDEMFPRKLQESFEENLNFQHMLCHLFDIAESYDLSEEVGRKALDGLIRKCLRDHQWHHKLLNKLIQIGSKLAPKLELFTNEVYNIIFDIWQPFEENPNQTGYFREYEFKRAQLKVKLTRLENELSYAIASANYEMSRKVEMELNEYRAKLENLSKEGPPLEMIRKPTEDPAKLCWCLDLLCALLMVYANHEHLPSSLNMFKDDFLLPLIWDKRAEILTRALKCMGIYCIYDQETAKLYHHLGTFKIHINKYKSMKLYNKKVVMNSVSLTCDLLMIHGVDWLDNEEEIDIGMSAIEGEPSKNQKLSFDSFIHVLLRMLQDEDYEMRDLSVTVFAKLMCCGLPISSMSTSKLILKWFRLSSKSSAAKALQHKIGMILGAYVNSGNDAKKNVIEAIVPVLTVIAKAPPWSSLSLIDIDLAVQFMAIISDSGNSKVFLHSQLARILLDEIDLGPAKNATIYFAKMLNLLNITLNQSSEIQDIIDKVEKIFEEKTLSKAVMQHLARFLKKLKNGNNTTAISTSMSFNSTKTSVNRAKPLHIKAKKLGSRIKDITEKDPEDNELPRTEVQANISHILPEQASANTSADQTKPLHIQTKKLSSGIKHIIQKDPKDNELPRTEVEANISDVLPEQITKPQQPAPDQNISSSGSDIIGTTHTPVPMFNKILRVNLVRLPIKISRDNTSSDSDSDTAPPPAKYRRIRTPKDKTNSSSDSDTNSPPKKRQRLITRKVEMPGSAPKNKTENYSKKILKEPLATLPINTKGLEETVASHPAPEADSVFFDKSSIQSPQGNNLEKTNSSKDSHVTSSKESALSKSEDVVPIAQENFVENEIFSSWSSVEEIEKNLETNKSCEEHVDSNAQQSLKHIESAEESIISNEEDEKNSHYFFSGMSNVSFCTEESTDDISANTKLDEKKTASALEEVDVPQPSPEAKIVFSDKSRALSSQDVQEKRSPRKQRLSQEKTVSTSSNHSILSKSEDVGSLVEENEVLSSWSSIEEVEKIAQQNLEEIETDKDKGGNNQVYCSFGMSNVLSRKEEIPPSTQDSSAKPILDNNKSASVDVPQPSPEAKIVFSDKSRAPSSQDFRDKRSPEKQRSPQEKTFSTFNKSSLSESEDVGPLAKENVVLSSWSSIEELEKISQSNLMEIEPSAESIVSISDNEDKEGNIQAYCSSGMSNESSRTEEIPTSTQASSAKLILDNNKTVSDSTRTLGSRQSTTTDDTSSLMSNSYQQDLESSISAASDDSDDRHSSPISIRRSLDRKASNRTKIRSRSSKTLFLDEIDAAASDTDENIDDDPHR
ncbi:unnamed protein product [Ceutorhynchus assimilis]|uniref:Nuclear condensin complex subunit 3 C-terminal domain-containing protein n=1 Tax=Ceutorhynchus assimilis TaxID=467358 RepID=A0A9P0DNC9_9CUCU|nr:unnamed protein product [Ceutorhynchus assimilis]